MITVNKRETILHMDEKPNYNYFCIEILTSAPPHSFNLKKTSLINYELEQYVTGLREIHLRLPIHYQVDTYTEFKILNNYLISKNNNICNYIQTVITEQYIKFYGI